MIDHLSDTWHARDGWPLRRARFAPEQGSGKGLRGSLLFLAGRGDHMEKYAETMDHWAKAGWAVESFDWRGQGGSGRLSDDPLLGHVENFDSWLDDLEAYAAEWRDRTSPPHVMIGHSMGGHLLTRTLGEGRVTADAAVLVAPMFALHAVGLPRGLAHSIVRAMCATGGAKRPLWSPRRRSRGLDRTIRKTLTHSEQRYEQERKIRRERPELVMDAPSWGWLRAAFVSNARLEEAGFLEGIETPMLILATRGDRLVSTPEIVRMARRLPHGQVHVYGRAVGHEILREVDRVRDDALARIDAFLAANAPARRGAPA
ncbi:MAG: alpha/beta fold hydrolase [Sphingobium sp.]